MHVGFLWNSRFASQNYHNGRILSILEHHPSLQAVPDGAWAACFGCSRSCATASWGPEAVPRIGWVPLWTSCERTCCKRMQQDCALYHNIYLQISTNKGHGPPRSQIVACGSYFSIYYLFLSGICQRQLRVLCPASLPQHCEWRWQFRSWDLSRSQIVLHSPKESTKWQRWPRTPICVSIRIVIWTDLKRLKATTGCAYSLTAQMRK